MARESDSKAGVSRRAFFGTAAGAAAAGAAAAMGGARPAVAQQTGTDRTRARYQETEHVQTFYRTNRYTRPQE
jgi:phospholipase C